MCSSHKEKRTSTAFISFLFCLSHTPPLTHTHSSLCSFLLHTPSALSFLHAEPRTRMPSSMYQKIGAKMKVILHHSLPFPPLSLPALPPSFPFGHQAILHQQPQKYHAFFLFLIHTHPYHTSRQDSTQKHTHTQFLRRRGTIRGRCRSSRSFGFPPPCPSTIVLLDDRCPVFFGSSLDITMAPFLFRVFVPENRAFQSPLHIPHPFLHVPAFFMPKEKYHTLPQTSLVNFVLQYERGSGCVSLCPTG